MINTTVRKVPVMFQEDILQYKDNLIELVRAKT